MIKHYKALRKVVKQVIVCQKRGKVRAGGENQKGIVMPLRRAGGREKGKEVGGESMARKKRKTNQTSKVKFYKSSGTYYMISRGKTVLGFAKTLTEAKEKAKKLAERSKNERAIFVEKVTTLGYFK